jgi:DHA1 family tetracycline resistance protein-like MFS transporter
VSESPYPRKEAPSRAERYGLTFIFITLLIDVLGFGLVIPITPALITQLSHGTISSSSRLYGLLIASYGLMQFFSGPILGSLSDRIGRRPVLLAALLFNGFDYMVMALAPAVGWLFVGRIASGIAGASFTAGSAYIADISPPEKRAQNFGLIGAAFGVGFVVGPALGGYLGGFDPRLPFWAAAGLSILNFTYGLIFVPESLAPENRRPFSLAKANPVGSLGLLSRYPSTILMGGVLVLSGLAQQSLQSTWVLSTTYKFNWTTKQNGIALALVGLTFGLVQAGLSRILIPKMGEPRAFVIGTAISCFSFFLLGSAVATWMMYASILIWSLSGLSGPALQSILSKSYGPDEQGALQGAMTSVQSLTGIVGPIVATAIFAYYTSPKAPAIVPGAAFFFAAALSVAALVVGIAAVRRPEVANQIQAE